MATTQISLIKEHTRTIKPPRALWVSFPLGRPLGTPSDPTFQTAVLKAALNLLERSDGPILEDYPFDAEEPSTAAPPLACPVNFETRQDFETEQHRLISLLQQEIAVLHAWHEHTEEHTVSQNTAASGLKVTEIATFFANFLSDSLGDNLPAGRSCADQLRLAAEDLKSFYFRAITAQPGQTTDPAELSNWFWGETYGAACINEVRKKCLEDDARDMQLAGKLLLVPRNQLHRFQD